MLSTSSRPSLSHPGTNHRVSCRELSWRLIVVTWRHSSLGNAASWGKNTVSRWPPTYRLIDSSFLKLFHNHISAWFCRCVIQILIVWNRMRYEQIVLHFIREPSVAAITAHFLPSRSAPKSAISITCFWCDNSKSALTQADGNSAHDCTTLEQ